MLKGVEELNNYLTNWFKSNGYDINCKLSTNFCYNTATDEVNYSIFLPAEQSGVFAEKVCEPLVGNVYDPFILFLFHEVGHKYTIDKFSKKDLEYYFANKPASTDYYYLDIEYEATKWGCEYIKNNLEKVRQLYEEFMLLVRNFYTLNELVY